MNEEEIIEILKELKDKYLSSGIAQFSVFELDEDEIQAIDGIINLYNKEKEKNNSISIQYEKVVDKLEDLEQIEKEHKEENGRLRDRIKELEKEKEKNKELMNKQLDFWFWLDDEEKKTTIKNMYIRKDKIRNKIKDLEKEIQEKHEYCTDFTLICEHEIDTNGIIRVLQELLEESDK